jgi:trehalose-6-phosphatase
MPKTGFFLDYDGTLVNFVDKPENAKPDPELLELIKTLTKLRKTKVVLISGGIRKPLEPGGRMYRLNSLLNMEYG